MSHLLDALLAVAALVAILDYFGIKPKQASVWRTMPLSQKWKLAIMLGLVAAAIGMSGYSVYRSLRPKIVEKIVEKPVDRIVEKIVRQACPEPTPKVESKKPQRSISQHNQDGSNNTNTQIGTAQAPVAIAPNGIANAVPNWGTQTVVNGPPPAILTFREDSVSSTDDHGMKILKVHVFTDRSIPAAHIGLLFSGPIELVNPGSPYEPKLSGSAISQFNWGGINKNGMPIDYGMSVQINMPAAFTPGQDLIVTVKSKTAVHVTDVGQLAN